ncbi:uncharacterized protein LOC108149314 [Drosophila elegans]|uniref:uncharacterized protein LOC108149314 n=1 Tax=Drosophila elegans TaxID=30023 RepID=UPI0007E7FB12|nr:uncharacterized protein LOC108149314 [Drosophila elegans]
MYSIYSRDDVAAYEEVDDSQLGPSAKITPEQRAESELQSIIFLAQQEHEAQTLQQVITAIKLRKKEELANPLPRSFVRNRNVFDEEVRVLLDQIGSKEENSDEDDEESIQ